MIERGGGGGKDIFIAPMVTKTAFFCYERSNLECS